MKEATTIARHPQPDQVGFEKNESALLRGYISSIIALHNKLIKISDIKFSNMKLKFMLQSLGISMHAAIKSELEFYTSSCLET